MSTEEDRDSLGMGTGGRDQASVQDRARTADNPRTLWSDGSDAPDGGRQVLSSRVREENAQEEDQLSADSGAVSSQGAETAPSPSHMGGSGSTEAKAGPRAMPGSDRSDGATPEGSERGQGANDGDDDGGRGWKVAEDILLWAAWLVMVGFNAYAEAFRFNGTTTKAVAAKARVWLMPAGYTFAIWGVIYIALAVWLVRFCLGGPSRKRLWVLPFTLSGIVFVATCCLNVAWLALWHLDKPLPALVVIFVLTCMVWLLYSLVRRDATKAGTPTAARLLDWVPLSLYASWLSVASLVNAAYLLVRMGSNVSDVLQGFATIIVVGLLFVVSFLMFQKLRDWVFGLVMAWSAIGIGIQVFAIFPPMGVIVVAVAAIGTAVTFFPWNKFTLTRR